jgi:exonuclease III
MKIATWNVNSLNVRLPQVLDWLAAQPSDAPVDVLALQELKLTDDKFPPWPSRRPAMLPNGSARRPTTAWP